MTADTKKQLEELKKQFENKWFDGEFDGEPYMGMNGMESDPDHEKVFDWLTQALTQAEERGRKEWIKEGLFTDGWKIEITHKDKDKVESNRQFLTQGMLTTPNIDIFLDTVKKMLHEFNS